MTVDNYQQVFITDYLLVIVIDYLSIFKCLLYCMSTISISTWFCNLVRIREMWINDWMMDGWISNWVRGLSAPMHLGLNRRALCAPYWIIGAVAPRLKILMTSGSKKGTQIYYFFSLKSPSKWTPSRFPSGAPVERETCLQDICIYLKDLIKIPLVRRHQERNAHPCSPKVGPLWK